MVHAHARTLYIRLNASVRVKFLGAGSEVEVVVAASPSAPETLLQSEEADD